MPAKLLVSSGWIDSLIDFNEFCYFSETREGIWLQFKIIFLSFEMIEQIN